MGRTPLTLRFAQAMDALNPPGRIGIAVSGGGDSMALMHLAQRWGGAHLQVASIDHGLRPEALRETAMVAQSAYRLGLPHVTLRWHGWDGRGNLQDNARRARQALLRDWAKGAGLDAVLVGHTQDDQAETVLMRLARGSGVDGLAGMAAARDDDGLRWLRPLVGITRAELRDWLQDQGVDWAEDPSNDDPSFDRVKARQALASLAPMGLSTARLAETAQRMAEAREVLDMAARDAANRICRIEHGDIIFDAPALDALPAETRNRLVAEALCAVTSAPYRPRLAPLRAALTASRATLHGALLTRSPKALRITREFQAVQHLWTPPHKPWDTRWHLTPPDGTTHPQGAQIRALGPDGLAQCPDKTAWQLPHASLLSSPALWRDQTLLAAPLAGLAPDWRFSTLPQRGVLAFAANSH